MLAAKRAMRAWVLCVSTEGVCLCVAQLLEWRASIETWASVYFLGHILMGSIILASLIKPPRRPRKKEVAKEAATQPQPPIETGKC